MLKTANLIQIEYDQGLLAIYEQIQQESKSLVCLSYLVLYLSTRRKLGNFFLYLPLHQKMPHAHSGPEGVDRPGPQAGEQATDQLFFLFEATLQVCSAANRQYCKTATLQICDAVSRQRCKIATLQICDVFFILFFRRCKSATLQLGNFAKLRRCKSAT